MRCGVCWIFVLLRDCKYTPKTEMAIRTHQATASHLGEKVSFAFPKHGVSQAKAQRVMKFPMQPY